MRVVLAFAMVARPRPAAAPAPDDDAPAPGPRDDAPEGGATVTWIEDVRLSSPNVSLVGANRPSRITLVHTDDAPLGEVAVQAWVEQGKAERAACGKMVRCGAALGVLPAGTCEDGFVVGTGTNAAGRGALAPGDALLRFDLQVAGRVVDSLVVPVTLVAD